MIRVDSIAIKEFRGIRDLTMNLKQKSFAVAGPNGTGKSGIVDALEFVLTGSISRLSGKGTGNVSVKDHGPHVDSRNRPDSAKVTLTGFIPSIKKNVTIERSVRDAAAPKISPDEPDVREVLATIASHPEFVLTRRELIKYVLSAPGERAKAVQILLRLDDVESVRSALQRIANATDRQLTPLRTTRTTASAQLASALSIGQLRPDAILGAVNPLRARLGLPAIATLEANTNLSDGMLTVAVQPGTPQRIGKAQALKDIQALKSALQVLTSTETTKRIDSLVIAIAELKDDPAAAAGATKDRLLNDALASFEDDECPVCGTDWDPTEFKRVVGDKLKHLDVVGKKKAALRNAATPIVADLRKAIASLTAVDSYCATLLTGEKRAVCPGYKTALEGRAKAIAEVMPFDTCLAALAEVGTVPRNVSTASDELERAVDELPDPSDQEAARHTLTIAQERLEAYRRASQDVKQQEEKASLAHKALETYATVSTEVLNGIYESVQGEFAAFYKNINRDNESKFSARLAPAAGKLDLDVDFFGRGFFPPGAYHSEGHQDGMGLCLYLALMRHLLGKNFTFAVLDDVLMSVDAGHRREVCKLLKEEFPDTQFVLTTHDPIWLKHMKTEGLIGAGASVQFRTWSIDHGPTEWDDRDIWKEVDDSLARNDVRAAASLLRHYLEFVSRELCHRLRAPVEFRGDDQFMLGDLLPKATSQFRKLLAEGKQAASSWNQKDRAEVLAAQEGAFAKLVTASNVEQWQINPAIHYNQWENLNRADFEPVAHAYKALVAVFSCDSCGSLLAVTPERGSRQNLRCACAKHDINLARK